MTCTRSLILLTFLLTCLGCAISPGLKEALLDPGKQQRERKEEIKRLVEHRHQQAHLQAATAMLNDGRYDECTRILDELEKADPDSPETHLMRAEVYMSQDRFDEAAAIYAQLVEKKPEDANLHHLHAMALEFSGDTTGALVAFQRAAELSPGSNVIRMSQLPDAAADTTQR